VKQQEQGFVIAILPFINGGKYRISCVVENMFKRKTEDKHWSLHVRHITYVEGLFKRDEEIMNMKDSEMPLSQFYEIESSNPKFDYYPCFKDDAPDAGSFILLPENSLVVAINSFNLKKLDPVDIFRQIFSDITVTPKQKHLLKDLLDSTTPKKICELIPPLLFALDQQKYPSAVDHERIFCSRAAACYNLILCMGEIEQVENKDNSMLQNSYSMILKCAAQIASTAIKEGEKLTNKEEKKDQ